MVQIEATQVTMVFPILHSVLGSLTLNTGEQMGSCNGQIDAILGPTKSVKLMAVNLPVLSEGGHAQVRDSLFPKRRLLCLISGVSILLFTLLHASLPAQTLHLASEEQCHTTIIIPSTSDLGVIAAASRIRDYMSKVTGRTPHLWTDSEVRMEDLEAPNIILAGQLPTNRWPKELLSQVSCPESGEGFAIHTLTYSGRDFIIVRGADSGGIRYGLHRLLLELEVASPGKISLGPLQLVLTPTVANRVLGLFWNGGLAKDVARRKNPENWPLAKLQSYLELMDSLGYNGLQTWDNLAGNYRGSDYSFSRSEWRNKLIPLLVWNHTRGWKNLLFVWANTVYDPASRSSKTVRDLTNPSDMKLAGDYYDYQASLAPYLDYFVSHNQDPGGGDNLADVQMLHLMLRARFSVVNSLARPAFSYWFMFDSSDWWGWEGSVRDGVMEVLDMGILPRDSIQVIGVHGGREKTWSDTGILTQVAEKGYETGVWAWYWADFEYQPGLHVHTKRLGAYFETLPLEVARQLAFHTVDSHNHERNLPSLYVAAQMLWNPRANAETLLREYCQALYGPLVGKGVASALLDLAKIRCDNPFGPGYCGAGTDDPASDLTKAQRWQGKLEDLQPDLEWVPKFNTMKPPELQIADICEAFRQIAEFARFRILAREAGEAIRKADIDQQKLAALIAELPSISPQVVEYERWRLEMSEIEKALRRRELSVK
jgi:hypothetical protein